VNIPPEQLRQALTRRAAAARRRPVVSDVQPQYGINYGVGYAGFTFRKDDLISHGIAYFTRWERLSDIKVSHVFVVENAEHVIGAHAGTGVARASIGELFDDPGVQVFFRKPRYWTRDIGERIVSKARPEIGKEYDLSLILAGALQATFLGKFLNKIFGRAPDRFVSRLLNSEDEWICSELVAYCMDEQPEYRDVGILLHPNETISPQELFEDEEIFEPWHGRA
jgi:hypothetical protein